MIASSGAFFVHGRLSSRSGSYMSTNTLHTSRSSPLLA